VQVAQKEAKNRGNPLRTKKLFLLAALLVEQYHDEMKSTSRAKAKKRGPEVCFSNIVLTGYVALTPPTVDGVL